MDDQKECIFCFEILQDYDATNIDVYKNETLNLSCKHTFHMRCFIKYITIKYKNKKFNDTINCPLCRHSVNNSELKNICIINIKRLSQIKQDILKKIIKHKTKMSFDKIKLYSRKLLHLVNLQRDVYNKSLEDYEELIFLYGKIKYLIRETYFVYNVVD